MKTGAVPVPEADFEHALVDYAHLMGYRVAGFRPARVQRRGEEPYETG